jgi:hypothetical protein
MTALLAFLKAEWPYLLALSIGAAGSFWLTHTIDGAKYARLQATLVSHDAQYADEHAKAETALADALQAQTKRRLETEANNGKIISQLQSERDSAAADRDFARRLLAAAQAGPAASGDAVSTASGQQRASDAPTAPGDRSLAQDLGDAVGECRNAIQRLAALQAQIIPQL